MTWKILGIITCLVIVFLLINSMASNTKESKDNRYKENKREYLQELRKSSDTEGYVILERLSDDSVRVVKNNNDKFTIYKTKSDCSSDKNHFIEKYVLESKNYECQLF